MKIQEPRKTTREEINFNVEFNTGWGLIDYLDDIPEFRKYKNKNASYDDIYYEIPTKIFTQVTGWGEKEVEDIQSGLEPYEGSITWINTNPNKYKENKVLVIGGA